MKQQLQLFKVTDHLVPEPTLTQALVRIWWVTVEPNPHQMLFSVGICHPVLLGPSLGEIRENVFLENMLIHRLLKGAYMLRQMYSNQSVSHPLDLSEVKI